MKVQTTEKTYKLEIALTETELLGLIHEIDAIYPKVKVDEITQLLALKNNLALTLANY